MNTRLWTEFVFHLSHHCQNVSVSYLTASAVKNLHLVRLHCRQRTSHARRKLANFRERWLASVRTASAVVGRDGQTDGCTSFLLPITRCWSRGWIYSSGACTASEPPYEELSQGRNERSSISIVPSLLNLRQGSCPANFGPTSRNPTNTRR